MISELMASNSSRKKDPQEILKEMEAERLEMEERFTIKAGEEERLREQDVLSKFYSLQLVYYTLSTKYTPFEKDCQSLTLQKQCSQ